MSSEPNRDVGGRRLSYHVGQPKYDRDPYRGQRRRPWMCFRVGAHSMDFSAELFVAIIEKVHHAMVDAGILLEDQKRVLKISSVEQDYDALRVDIDEQLRKIPALYDKGPMSTPVVIFIYDIIEYSDTVELDNVSYEYSDRIYGFKVTREEVISWINEIEFSSLDQECVQFATFIKGVEGLVESIAVRIQPDDKVNTFGRDLAECDADDEDDVLNINDDAQVLDRRLQGEEKLNEQERLRRLANLRALKQLEMSGPPPGLSRNMQSTSERRTFPPPPPGLEPQKQMPRSFGGPRTPPGISLPPPPGIPIGRPPGIPAQQSRPPSSASGGTFSDISLPSSIRAHQPPPPPRRDEREEEEEVEIDGNHILSHADVLVALKVIKDKIEPTSRGVPVRKHDSTMIRFINGTRLYERVEFPFVDITHNIDLLIVINYSLGSRARDVQDSAKQVLRGVFRQGFPIKLRQKYLDRLFVSGRWSTDAATLFFEIVVLYFNTARYQGGFMLTVNSFVPSWRELWDSFSNCNQWDLHQGGHVTDAEFQNLDKLTLHINRWIKNAEDAARTADIVSPDLRSIDGRDSRSGRLTGHHSLNSSYSGREAEDLRRREEEEKEHRRREEEEYRRRDQEEYRRRREEDDYRRREKEEYRRRQQEDSRRREQEYLRSRDERRLEQERLGFQNGGGTVETIYRDDDFPDIDISDSTVDDERQEEKPEEPQEQNPPLPTHNSDERPKQPYKYVEGYEDDYQPPWMRCERIEPPEDFKTFTEVPTLADYVNPTEPYLRRIQELGVYKSAHHYLDVQFRLLREDLVSPMRDGLDIYRKNGTCKGHRIEGQPCSDISIYNIERVDGKQVTERDGFEMRIIWPAQYDISNLIENDREMKELGLVILSNDRFEEDFHLGHIQTSLLGTKGCLHLAVHEETRPFESNKTYQMAQATSYLPSYKHVLKNLKEISPFKPMPFERYIVHGRKDIYRPYFHRFPKSQEQIEDEHRLDKIYTEIRSDAASKRFMAGKRIPSGMDGDSYECVRGEPTKEEIDLEYMQLKEPMLRGFVGVDSRDNDLIQIDRKWYKISRLLDDFHPTNMDESQRRAYCNTFKHELSLIQGPPGTGKTHIGVQIIKTMLQNRAHWKMTEPILVVCFTNSGLDNLLERIYEMIENDDELSKDNGKPKMIRYGRKCDSEYLKRRRVMRFDVHDQYRSTVSDRSQSDQNKAGAHKRKVGADLVLSSFTLYCSRNEILSHLILSRVMDPKHQEEISTFACEHVDSKEIPLNSDEAIACWLLDRDFGKATKAQTKNAKKNKYLEMENVSDEEDNTAFLTIQDSDDDEDYEEMDDEKRLDKLFDKMNVGCTGKDILGMAKSSAGDEYYTKGSWEIAREHRPPEVVLLGKKQKSRNSKHAVDEHINGLLKEVREMILSTQPLPKHELEDCKHLFSLTRPKRWALYATWCEAVRNLVIEGLPKQITDYRLACQRLICAQDCVDAEIMKMPMIIGATTTGCSRLRPILELVEPRILIVEEAAEVLEAHILSAMISSVEHCVMIGDHKQLRPNPAVHELGTEYGMRISMFERLVERALPYSQLREQHRMNLNISDIIVKPAFYDNVVDAENVTLYPQVEGMATNLYFWSHSRLEETPDGISWLNKHEALMTVQLVKYLLKQNYNQQDIVVLSTYAAQRQYMYREFPTIFGLSSTDNSLIPVETVDSFQGRERKIAIVSLVRSHRGEPINTGIGFLAVANRICVALTRAQHGMYIIGNGAYIMNNSQLWKKIVDQLNRKRMIEYSLPLKCVAHEKITMISDPHDFDELCPEGGCLQICNIQKRCGHICQRKCHPKIEDEHLLRCEQPCQKLCPNPQYHHKCSRLCYEECGSCMKLVEVQLPCAHTISTPCSRIQVAQCDQKCTKRLVCGHICPNKCGTVCIDPRRCEELVNLTLPCNHSKKLKCCELTTTDGSPDLSCVEACPNRMLTCEHRCKELCGAPCTLECQEIVTIRLPCGHDQEVVCSSYEPNKLEKIACTTLIPKKLIPCGHSQKVQCSQEPSTDLCSVSCPRTIKSCGHICADRCGTCFITQNHICQQMCQLRLKCGHQCSAKCSQKCPPCKSFCANFCPHEGCGTATSRNFGRDCSSMCVLCTSNCFNKCIHRSCTLKCYEECNVRACQEPCGETLKCGHACLGMCGEACPKICGTCERSSYLQCVKGSATQRIHRLIQIPRCRCIIPVEQLDEHVRKQKERNDQLTCSKCNSSLAGVLRYAKYMKKHVLEQNLKKQMANVSNIHQTTLVTNLCNVLNECTAELLHITTNINDDKASTLKTFKYHLSWIISSLEEYKTKGDQKWRIGYLLEVSRCMKAIAKLISMMSKQRVSSRKDIPPSLDTIIIQSFGTQPFNKLFEELRKVNDLLAENLKTFMLGTVLQKLRMFIFKMAAYQLISSMIHTLCCYKQGISDQTTKAIHSSCFAVLNADDRQNLTSKLALLEEQVTTAVPRMTDSMARYYWSWEQLEVPEL